MRPGERHRLWARRMSPLGRILAGSESLLFGVRDGPAYDGPSLVFLVGAPRSGTTIAFQCLTRRLDVAFPTHLTALVPQAPVLALLLSSIVFRRPHRAFQSMHGFSQGDGWRGPNEWETLFRDHVVAPLRRGLEPTPELERLCQGVDRVIRQPVAVKFLNASLIIGALAERVPRSRFLWIDRAPIPVARSILRAKWREGKAEEEVWYVTNDALDSRVFASEAEQVAKQVATIRSTIAEDFGLLSPERRAYLSYEALCADPEAEMRRLSLWLGDAVRMREGGDLHPFPEAVSIPLDDGAERTFRRVLGSPLSDGVRLS